MKRYYKKLWLSDWEYKTTDIQKYKIRKSEEERRKVAKSKKIMTSQNISTELTYDL